MPIYEKPDEIKQHTVIDCSNCSDTFDPYRETGFRHGDKRRCPSCGTKHYRGDERTDKPEKDTKRTKRDLEETKNDGVYLICSGEGHTKIGVSVNPERRLKEIQTGSPFDLTVDYYIECDNAPQIERKIHKKYNDAQLEREWFELSLVDKAKIVKEIEKEAITDT